MHTDRGYQIREKLRYLPLRKEAYQIPLVLCVFEWMDGLQVSLITASSEPVFVFLCPLCPAERAEL